MCFDTKANNVINRSGRLLRLTNANNDRTILKSFYRTILEIGLIRILNV